MELSEIRQNILFPAFSLLPEVMNSPKAEVMLLAIGLQESRFNHRRQINGPAKGFWQFEQYGGVRGVLVHPSTKLIAEDICAKRNCSTMLKDVYERLEYDDILAACFARLFLWTGSQDLPAIGQVEKSWDYYIRIWRPGIPHRHTWNTLYVQAMDEVVHGLVAQP